MPADNQIHSHRLDRQRCVDECLALGQAAGTRRKVDCVRSQSPGGKAEAGSGAGRVFEEQIRDDLTIKGHAAQLSHLI